ncbi:hypothetical protein [Cellulomonas phragmiteti]|uniref:hypothetical protein n=1 Tax=Cellulomonas phragmiteti TaxID=478780 RepID=UPI0019447E76|nr:hypothetical protein [Cellulomonas phragmiteti]
MDPNNPLAVILHEAKEGFVTERALKQIERDAAIRVRDDNVSEVVWHFFMSGTTGMVGPSQEILDALNHYNIPYYIHITA